MFHLKRIWIIQAASNPVQNLMVISQHAPCFSISTPSSFLFLFWLLIVTVINKWELLWLLMYKIALWKEAHYQFRMEAKLFQWSSNIKSQWEDKFDLVVVTQDWHPKDHVSFASQHEGRHPFENMELDYNDHAELCKDKENNGTRINWNFTIFIVRFFLLPFSFFSWIVCISFLLTFWNSEKYAVFCDSASHVLNQTLWPDHCVIDTEDANFVPGLIVKPSDIVIRKGYRPQVDSYSIFNDNGQFTHTRLNKLLKKQGITTLYLSGLATDYCIFFSALDAIAIGYETFIIEDACKGINPTTIINAEEKMMSVGVKIINASQIPTTFS